MADLSITPANVATVVGTTQQQQGIAGEAILAGQSLALSPVDGRYYKADNNGSATLQRCDGVAVNSAPGAGQPVAIAKQGAYVAGGTVVVGTTYAVSATPGGICPTADLTSGMKVSIIGVGISATQIDILLHNSGVAVP